MRRSLTPSPSIVVTTPPYKPHPPHRNRAPEKSQWLISEDDERRCFANAWKQGWIDSSGEVAWGLKADVGRPPKTLVYRPTASDVSGGPNSWGGVTLGMAIRQIWSAGRAMIALHVA